MFFNNKFILASSSYSRYKILKQNGLNFTKKKPLCNETTLKKNLLKKKYTPKRISLELAKAKAKSIANKNINKLVIGSDTIIQFNNVMFKKAENIKDAKKKIQKLSGKTHILYSSAAAFYNKKIVWSATQKTYIKIRKLNDKEIKTYLNKAGKNVLYSVGCYQIEKAGPNIIENIKGDFFNVMGFPLFPFLFFLKKFSIKK